MTTEDLPELFPGFESGFLETRAGKLFCRIGGDGPPLLLVHGYPQSHAMWHKVAPELSRHFTLVVPDLPGYGQSAIPALSTDHAAYSKRFMAGALADLMAALGHDRFALVGHDRGARVSYRMALDHPELLTCLVVLDILPTHDYWKRLDRTFALQIYHWAFLAQPAPFPENMIAPSALHYLEHTLASWTASKDLSSFHPDALTHYRAFFSQADRIAATCEDYRAGAGIDVEHDAADLDAGNRIRVPTLAIWGGTGIAQAKETPLSVWRNWADDVTGAPVESGHFVAEENPDDLLREMLPFLRAKN
jgi:haloacetate dehalogenase